MNKTTIIKCFRLQEKLIVYYTIFNELQKKKFEINRNS